jgi:serine/threonine-protein kinase
MIEFRMLGSVELRSSDGLERHALLAQPKRIALLAYLCLARPRGFHRRDTLVGLFWPESDQAHARTSLRNALHVLRRGLGDSVILSRGDEEVAVDAATLRCDVLAFEDAVAAGRLEEALALYRGDLLTGFFLTDVPAFERWLEQERTHLRTEAARAARETRNRHLAAGDLAASLEAAHRAVVLADTDEGALRTLLGLLEQTGDRAGALQGYDSFAKRLDSEYGLEPSAETRGLVEAIRAGRNAHTVSSAGDVPASRVSIVPPPEAAIAAPPSVTVKSRAKPWGRRVTISAVGAALLVGVVWATIRLRAGTGAPTAASRRQLTFDGNAYLGALSPDGQFLAHAVNRSDTSDIVVRETVGGKPTRVATVPIMALTIEWSPDAKYVLVTSPGKFLIAPRLGGEERPLTLAGPAPTPAHAYWLPGGERVSGHGDAGRMQILDLRTGERQHQVITDGLDWKSSGSWSPDGRFFAVATHALNSQASQILAVRFNEGTEVVVSDTMELLTSPRWSPDGRAIYYARGLNEIWKVRVSRENGRPEGRPARLHDQLEMLPHRARFAMFSLSADGHKLAYTRDRRFSNLWLITPGPAGSDARRTQITTGTALRWRPVVSPDGRWIAFVERTGGAGELFRMPIEGGIASQITFGAQIPEYSYVAWSPDGSQLAFGSRRSGRAQVWIADVKDGGIRALAGTRSMYPAAQLTWAPSAMIAYRSDDSNAIRLVHPVSGDEQPMMTPVGKLAGFHPRVAPDGRRIALERHKGGIATWVFDPADSSLVRLLAPTRVPAGWSTDGHYVYALQDGRAMYRVDSRGKDKGQLLFTFPPGTPHCTPAGPLRPRSFICALYDIKPDIWMIDPFDPERN